MGFVLTGFGGEKVVINGGVLVLLLLRETMRMNIDAMRLAVERKNSGALIAFDRLRIDGKAEFFVRVRPDAAAIAMAGQTLGLRTMQREAHNGLVEGGFVDALRSVDDLTINQLHEQHARLRA